jgi:hypothetical protein
MDTWRSGSTTHPREHFSPNFGETKSDYPFHSLRVSLSPTAGAIGGTTPQQHFTFDSIHLSSLHFEMRGWRFYLPFFFLYILDFYKGDGFFKARNFQFGQ